MADDPHPRRPRMSFSEEDLPEHDQPPQRPRERTTFTEDDAPVTPAPPRRPQQPRPQAPRARTQRPRRRPPVGRIIGVLVLAWLVFLVATPMIAWSKTTKEPIFTAGERPAKHPGTVYLIAGSDSREGLDDAERERLGTGDAEGKRTDTMILFIVPRSGPPVQISLPRDSYVPIPGHGNNKLNAAYAIGGPELMVHTIEQVTGLHIDHYVEVGFGGFVNVIDAVGGIEICPKEAIQDKNSRLDVQAGCQNADGVTALAYARMRYADPLGDLGRMNRQREMLSGVAKKVMSPATVLNPVRWWGVNQGIASSLLVDEDTSTVDLMKVAPSIVQVGRGKGVALMVPVSDTDLQTEVGSAIKWDSEQALAMFEQIKTGDTTGIEKYKQDF